jgi:NAD(P)-dependent dehydrogenase (short-subunit alcohol dehydrogenase family)
MPPHGSTRQCSDRIRRRNETELTRENANYELLQHLAASYPIPRLGTVREVADLICFAASEAAGYITGASFDINGRDLMM